ncbi:hypothetical protein [Microcoleus sp. PH2017_22_RUC_O_B]|nr:hypothetical protein [Microcoleus sp. PH2017_22_RUC_O_B]
MAKRLKHPALKKSFIFYVFMEAIALSPQRAIALSPQKRDRP